MDAQGVLHYLAGHGVPAGLARRAVARMAASESSRQAHSAAARALIALAAGRKVQLPSDLGGAVVGGTQGVGVPGSEYMDPFEEDEIELRPWDSTGRAAWGRPGGTGPGDPGDLMPASRPRDPGTVMGSRSRPVDPGEVMGSGLDDKLVTLAARVAASG